MASQDARNIPDGSGARSSLEKPPGGLQQGHKNSAVAVESVLPLANKPCSRGDTDADIDRSTVTGGETQLPIRPVETTRNNMVADLSAPMSNQDDAAPRT